MLKKYLLLAILLYIQGCASVGPDYERPDPKMPPAWKNLDTSVIIDSADRAAYDSEWWRLFKDSVLTGLIETGLRNNPDIKIAAARVEEYLAYYGISSSAFYPQIDALGKANYGKLPRINETGEENTERATFRIEVSAGWELDLWGRIRRLNESARAEVLASEESRQGIVLLITSRIAASYIELITLRQQLEISKQTARSREEARKLFALRYEKGEISLVEVNQLESDYWNVMSKIPLYEKLIVQAENNIKVLIGEYAGNIPDNRLVDSAFVPRVPAGIPSKLLERRPDIKEAEFALVSANANIGAIKAEYYPRIAFGATVGVTSKDISTLFDAPSRLWNIGADILAPLFNAGRTSSRVEVAEAVKKQALINYVGTVQSAFRDVENSLADHRGTLVQLEYVKNRVGALSIYTDLARMNFDEGINSYLEVLDAESSLFDAQIYEASVRGDLLKSIVNIYSAFAGGWVNDASLESVQPEGADEVREIQEDR